MEMRKLFTTLAMVSGFLITGCGDSNLDPSPYGSSANNLNIPDNNLAASRVGNGSGPKGKLAVVNLGVAGEFAILSQSGITDVYKSDITGDVGTSPITGAALLLSCDEVVGTIYTVDAAGPLPCRVTDASKLTTAVGDMQAAYNDAAGRINPNFLNLGAGDIGGKILRAGLYKFTSAVVIPTDVTLAGNRNDVWIFQVAGTLSMSSAVNVTLSGTKEAARKASLFFFPCRFAGRQECESCNFFLVLCNT